jgi:predicted PurR-regulated permease PerM
MTEKPTAELAVVEAALTASNLSSEQPSPVLPDVPVNIRSLSLVVLAGLGCIFLLHWAKAIFIPVMLSLLFSYALSPVVNWLETRKVPRWLSAAVLLLAIVGSAGTTAYGLSDEAAKLVEALPVAAAKFAQNLKAMSGKTPSTLETMQKAASQIEQVAQDTQTAASPGRGVMRVVVDAPRLNLRDYLWTGTLGLVALLGQATAVLFLTYFLMLSGDTFRRKLLKLAGPRLSSKRVTLQALHEITDQIRRYLQLQVLTSALVGALTGLALWAIGLENSAAWGVLAGVLNFVPYLGSLAITGASAMVGFLQFGNLSMALIVGGASLAIHAVVGNLLTPWLTSKTSQLSPVAVFVGLLAWGWLWGVWGLLLGVPILMMVKAVCDRVDDLKPIGEFLGS